MTCIPCSYCSCVGALPTDAKWPFIAMVGGAVCREAAEGRWPFVLGCVFVADDIVAGWVLARSYGTGVVNEYVCS
jgi:hypothetical protein